MDRIAKVALFEGWDGLTQEGWDGLGEDDIRPRPTRSGREGWDL